MQNRTNFASKIAGAVLQSAQLFQSTQQLYKMPPLADDRLKTSTAAQDREPLDRISEY